MRRTRSGRATRARSNSARPSSPVPPPTMSPMLRSPSMALNNRFSARRSANRCRETSVRSVDQDRRRPRRQSLLNRERIGQPNRYIVEPSVAGKAIRLLRDRDHRRDKRPRCGSPSYRGTAPLRRLLRRRQCCDPRGLRDARHDAAERTVGRLSHPAAEAQACTSDNSKVAAPNTRGLAGAATRRPTPLRVGNRGRRAASGRADASRAIPRAQR